MAKRWIAVIVGAYTILNGLDMLDADAGWYDRITGVSSRGLCNPHFV